MKRQEFEKKYLNKKVMVKLFDGTIETGILFSTNEMMEKTRIPDMKNRYFIGTDIRQHGVRFRKSHIKSIKLYTDILKKELDDIIRKNKR